MHFLNQIIILYIIHDSLFHLGFNLIYTFNYKSLNLSIN